MGCSDNGISLYPAQFTFLVYEPTSIQIGLVEDMLIDRGNLYLATNQGVYKYSENQIRPIPGLKYSRGLSGNLTTKYS
jgi:hypothetical protein